MIQFLGFDPTNAQINSLFVQKVELDNTLGPVRIRNTFVNQSRNYRIEIEGTNPYRTGANDERPLWIVAKFGGRAFRYCVVNPGDRDYSLVEQLVGPLTGRSGKKDAGYHHCREKRSRTIGRGVPANLLMSPNSLTLVT